MNGMMHHVSGGSSFNPEWFVSTWNTANTSSGSSANNQITLPLVIQRNYTSINILVEWGDGNSDVITAYNQAEVTHTYASSGIYQIVIKPITAFRNCWSFNNTKDRLKLLSIQQWGTHQFYSGQISHNFMRGCANLTLLDVVDVPIFYDGGLGGGGNLINGFQGCTSLTNINNVNSWDVSSITDTFTFESMFSGCTNLDILIDNWDFTNKRMGSFMSGVTLSTSNYDAMLVSMASQPVLSSISPDFGNSKYTIGGAGEKARNFLTSTKLWTINDGGGI